MRTRRKLLMVLGVFGFLAATARSASAQARTLPLALPLSFTISDSLTLNDTVPGSPITFSGSPPTTGSITLSVTATLSQTRTVTIWAYFGTTTALANGPQTIATALIQGTATTSAPATSGGTGPFTATSPFVAAATGFQVAQESMSAGTATTPNATLVLSIPGGAAGMPAGTYTGTLNIAAIAI